jgi:tetratricopeptide (TPR) repeat protein
MDLAGGWSWRPISAWFALTLGLCPVAGMGQATEERISQPPVPSNIPSAAPAIAQPVSEQTAPATMQPVAQPIAQSPADLEPDDWWYRGFLLVRSAEELESQGKNLEAWNKLNEADPIFAHLAQRFPDFRPEIIKARRHLIAEKRDELKAKARLASAPRAPAPVPAPALVPPSSRPPQPLPVPGNPVGVAIASPEFPGSEAPFPNTPPPNRPYAQTEIQPAQELEIAESEEVIPDGEFSLPSWNDGVSQALPRASLPQAAPPPGMPRVQTGRSPGVGAIANSLTDDFAKKDALIDWLNQKNNELKSELALHERELQQARRDRDQALAQAARNRAELVAAEQAGGAGLEQKVAYYKNAYAEAMTLLDEANARNEALLGQLESSKVEREKLLARVADLERERDSLVEVVQGGGNGGSALKELMDRNRQLTEQLDRAEQLATSLSELNQEKDSDIALLKSEITKIKGERDQLLAENLRHQQSIEDLQRKLEMLSDGLSAEDKLALSQASPVERQENELLRSIVLTKLRREAQMKAAKEMLLAQLEKVGVRSDILLGLVEDMAQASQLTDEEKNLLRLPEFPEVADIATQEGAPSSGGGGGVSLSATLLAPASPGAVSPTLVRDQAIEVELAQIDKSARLDFQEGRYDEAESGFLEYLRYEPRSVPCLCNLGILKIAMKNYQESEYYLNKAIALEKTSGLAHYLLGRTYFLQNRLDEALTRFEEGLTYDPQNAKAHNCVGVISTRKGWLTRAERAFTNAVSIDPEFGDAHFNLALLHVSKEQPDAKSAEEHYFKALHLGVPRDAKIETFLEQGKLEALSVGQR